MLNHVLILFGFFTLPLASIAQEVGREERREKFEGIHFAGSTGFLSGSGGISSVNRKFEWSAGYGFLPRSLGGAFHSVFLKATYVPFDIRRKTSRLSWQPILAGSFLSQNFGDDLGMTWGPQYPDRYYWWNRSLRGHLFAATQLNWHFKKEGSAFKRLAFFFEVNTNDLYLSSYWRNRRAMSLYDVVFFGFGTKLYWK